MSSTLPKGAWTSTPPCGCCKRAHRNPNPWGLGRESDKDQKVGEHADTPKWTRLSGFRIALSPRSPGVGMGLIFAVSRLAQAIAGRSAFNEQQLGHLQNPACVADRVAIPVVVEIDVHVLAHRSPFPHPVRPPPQVRVLVGPAVQVMRVRSVQPHVHHRCNEPQHAGQAGTAHHAIRGLVPGQQVEHVVVHPAGMPELHRHRQPPRKPVEEEFQPGVVPALLRRELHQQHRPFVPQLVPPGEPRWAGPPVEAAVQLDGVEPLDVLTEAFPGRSARCIQHVLPMVVAPPRRPHPNNQSGTSVVQGRVTVSDPPVERSFSTAPHIEFPRVRAVRR